MQGDYRRWSWWPHTGGVVARAGLPWVFSRLDYADGQTEKDTAQL